MALPGAWESVAASDLDARDDGDSQIAIKMRDRDHINSDKAFDLAHAAVVSSTTLGVKTTILDAYRFFAVDAEVLLYRFDGLSSDGLTAARIFYTITPVVGAPVSGSFDTAALGAAYARINGTNITLNSDIRGGLSTVKLEVETLTAGQSVTLESSQNDNDAVISRTFRVAA